MPLESLCVVVARVVLVVIGLRDLGGLGRLRGLFGLRSGLGGNRALGSDALGKADGVAGLVDHGATAVETAVLAGVMLLNRLLALLANARNGLVERKVGGASALVGGCTAMSRKTHIGRKSSKFEAELRRLVRINNSRTIANARKTVKEKQKRP